MVWVPEVQTVYEEYEDGAEYPVIATGPSGCRRREHVHGLGLFGVDTSVYPRPNSRRSISARRYTDSTKSLASLITKSVESHIGKHRASRTSSSLSSPVSPPSPPSRLSPTQWQSSPALTDDEAFDESEEDITTYHANLARFKAERAERAAELGLTDFELEFDPSQTESSRLEELQLREQDSRRSTGIGLGREMRAYWGGGSNRSSVSSDNRLSRSSSQYSNSFDSDRSDRVGTEALREWWDKLGSDTPNSSPKMEAY